MCDSTQPVCSRKPLEWSFCDSKNTTEYKVFELPIIQDFLIFIFTFIDLFICFLINFVYKILLDLRYTPHRKGVLLIITLRPEPSANKQTATVSTYPRTILRTTPQTAWIATVFVTRPQASRTAAAAGVRTGTGAAKH